jgi:hypothetical protein
MAKLEFAQSERAEFSASAAVSEKPPYPPPGFNLRGGFGEPVIPAQAGIQEFDVPALKTTRTRREKRKVSINDDK